MKKSRLSAGNKTQTPHAGQRPPVLSNGQQPRREDEIARLRERIDQFRALLDHVPGSVARIDLAPKYVFVNKQFLLLTGLTEDQVIGRGVEVIRPFIDAASFAAMVDAVNTTMREQKSTEVEICGTDSKGVRRWLVQTAHPWYDRNKHFAGVEIMTTDITQQKCADEQMATYHQKLQLLVDERTAKLRKAEKELFEQNKLLSEKNIALRQVMGQLEEEKKSIAETVRNNMEQLILPQIDKIRTACTPDGRKYLQLLEYNLKEITAGFGKRGFTKLNTLTQKEIEICDMIKRGMSCKEIARLQNTSPRTVETHRNRIRKKLGISDTSVNLVTFLKNL
jgi:PAS domain S-box-containing protein